MLWVDSEAFNHFFGMFYDEMMKLWWMMMIQDKSDDIKVGVKSTALYFGERERERETKDNADI